MVVPNGLLAPWRSERVVNPTKNGTFGHAAQVARQLVPCQLVACPYRLQVPTPLQVPKRKPQYAPVFPALTSTALQALEGPRSMSDPKRWDATICHVRLRVIDKVKQTF